MFGCRNEVYVYDENYNKHVYHTYTHVQRLGESTEEANEVKLNWNATTQTRNIYYYH